MNLFLIIRPEAERDMAEARDWYEGQREGLGIEFLTAVEKVFAYVSEFPESYKVEYRGIRRAGMRRFPYVVYYRVQGTEILIIAVQHGRRSTRRWRGRA